MIRCEQPLPLKFSLLSHLSDIVFFTPFFSRQVSSGAENRTGLHCSGIQPTQDHGVPCGSGWLHHQVLWQRLDGHSHTLLCYFHSHLVFFRFSAPLTILSLSFFQTQSRWWVGCGVMREQFRPSLSTAQVATQSALPWTRLSSGTWTRSRERESSTLGSLLAFRG